MHQVYLQCIFRNSFINVFYLFMFNSCDMFNSAILHNVFQSSMHVLSIRYRNDLNLEMLFHYCTNFAFLSVLKNEQEQQPGCQNQDDKLHR